MFSYEDIFNTAGRFLERLENTQRNNLEYEDDLHAYFIFCYHLRDYLQIEIKKMKPQEEEKTIEKNVTDKIFNKSALYPALSICRDICNITKHGKPKDEKFGKNADYGKGIVNICEQEHIELSVSAKGKLSRVDEAGNLIDEVGNVGQSEILGQRTAEAEEDTAAAVDQHYYVVDSTGNEYDAVDVARQALAEWKSVCKLYGV